jgi:Ca-activated chloride channel family protein
LAEIQPIRDDPVAGLIDIPLPQETSLLPQTWPSRIALALLLAGVAAAIWGFVRHRYINRYRREALAELDRIRRADPEARSELLARLTLLVRRTALAAFPRGTVAPLVGAAWLSFLDRSYGGEEFSRGVGRLLVDGPYQGRPPDDAELQSLVGLVSRWIKVHHD